MRTSPITPNNTPITAIIAKSTCRNERSPLSQIKSINYGDNILATQEAETANADDAIMLNTQGNAACFTIGNLVILNLFLALLLSSFSDMGGESSSNQSVSYTHLTLPTKA